MELEELLKLEKKDIDAIKKKLGEVTELVQKLSTELYQKAAAEQSKKQQDGWRTKAGKTGKGNKGKAKDNDDNSEDNSSSNEGNDENVVDADYKVKDEK
ncbi:TPA: hypothetical protein HA246_00370 [Candidatus Woesearchaeota archaeon]|nr:hypothetical protein [Candidatus Woesearchaeota archaeon]